MNDADLLTIFDLGAPPRPWTHQANLNLNVFDLELDCFVKDSEVGSKIRLKPSNGEGYSDTDGYNGNARYYLQQAKQVHATKKPTDDEEMVRALFCLLSLDLSQPNRYIQSYVIYDLRMQQAVRTILKPNLSV